MSAASVRTIGRRDNLPVFPIEAGNKGESGASILFTYRLCARVSASQSLRNAPTFLLQRWMPPDLAILRVAKIDPDAIATIIRVTNGNFRLLHRLLTQIERILEINSRIVLTKGVVEAARETLVIGQV
jgi:hypothetical protein